MSKPELFRAVDEHVYASSLPRTQRNLEFLKRQGVGGIISLAPMRPKLAAKAKELGMEIVSIPITEDVPPSDKELSTAYDFIIKKSAEGKKTLIHCFRGRQRTSLMALNYLVSQGEHPLRAWQKQDYGAYQEHKDYLHEHQDHLKKLFESRRAMRRK